jgi:hypothetical protein
MGMPGVRDRRRHGFARRSREGARENHCAQGKAHTQSTVDPDALEHWLQLQREMAHPHVSAPVHAAGRGWHWTETEVLLQQLFGGTTVPSGQTPPSPGWMHGPPLDVVTTQTSPTAQPPHASPASLALASEPLAASMTPLASGCTWHAQPRPSCSQVAVCELQFQS